MKRQDELAKLFSDARLEPNKRFVRSLRGRLVTSQKKPAGRHVRWFGLRVLLPLTAGLAVALVLVGVTLLRPAPKQSHGTGSKGTILLSKLYGLATADELPQHSAITFWDITEATTGGPAAAACQVDVGDPMPPTRSLLFKDGNVTASWSKQPDGTPSMKYSEDPEMPAFDTDVLSPSRDLQVQSVLRYGVLSDQNGKPLPEDATTALKTTGVYDLYTMQAIKSKDGSALMPDCPVEFTHLRIDAATGMLTELAAYNGTMADDNLILKETHTITTGTGNFAAELSKFTAVGFNLQQAKNQQAQLHHVAHVENVAAGYHFLYDRSTLGVDTMTEIQASGGGTAAYSYRFAKQPKMVYRIYTAKADNQQPKDLAALQATAQAKGWQVIWDVKWDTTYQGYPKTSTETYVATDGTTDYGMLATGTPDIPYVYVEAPQSESSDIFWLLQQLLPFTPGSQPAE